MRIRVKIKEIIVSGPKVLNIAIGPNWWTIRITIRKRDVAIHFFIACAEKSREFVSREFLASASLS